MSKESKSDEKQHQHRHKETAPTYLVCYDGSENAEHTIDYLIKNARHDSKIILFGSFQTVDRVDPKLPTHVPGAVYVPSPGDEWVKKERERRAHVVSYHLLRAKQRLLESDREFADRKIHEMVAESDDVRATVVDVAHQHRVDAIVVGSRGHGTIKRALLGSLSSYLVHHFDGNVIVCRGTKLDLPAAAPAAKK